MSIKKIVVANRGEIAVRIIRAARELGIATVQLYSTADADTRAVKLADSAVEIGPPPAAKSYLNTAAILQAAQQHNADAVHPGYGFLAENAEFADAVTNAGLIFIGPSSATIRKMGDKITARQTAAAAGVPTVPGSLNDIQNDDVAKQIAAELGFPLMIKAAAGGGGRGIRIANNVDELIGLAKQASSEALAAFGDGRLYIEKLIANARHIEVQILADGKRAIHLYERECSLQRRRQKLWEEAPAAILNEEIRQKLYRAAVHLAEVVNYKGAGTVEFLYDEHRKTFYFIEMNTRIQVEHPVSEQITGFDLIRAMIKIANGETLRHRQNQIQRRGHAIEVRINAEDPAKNFLPSPGIISDAQFPDGPGVRFDSHIYAGYAVPPFYDSLLGKLIIWDEDRASAIKRLQRALTELNIHGVQTTKPLFDALARTPEVIDNHFDTNWLEHWLVKNSMFLTTEEETIT